MPDAGTERPDRPRREHIHVATVIWHCDPNAIVCQQGDHLMAFYETGYRADWRRISGHAFFQCRKCTPPQYFFACFTQYPHPMVTCYALSRESYEEWDKSDEPTPPTPELLYRLRDPDGKSYNPWWHPPRNSR